MSETTILKCHLATPCAPSSLHNSGYSMTSSHALHCTSSYFRVLHRIFLQKTREEIVRSKAAAAASKSRGTSLKAKGDRERARKKVTGTDVIEGAEVVWKKVQESKKEGRRARSNQAG